MSSYVVEDQRQTIIRSLRSGGFDPTGEPADRHGALQWTFAKSSEGLDRLILLSEASGFKGSGYRGVVDVVVERGNRYTKKRICETHTRDDFGRDLGRALKAAVRDANATNASDLKLSFEILPGETQDAETALAGARQSGIEQSDR